MRVIRERLQRDRPGKHRFRETQRLRREQLARRADRRRPRGGGEAAGEDEQLAQIGRNGNALQGGIDWTADPYPALRAAFDATGLLLRSEASLQWGRFPGRGERISGEVPCRPGDPWPFPHVAGYQKVGTAVRVGGAVAHIRPGDRRAGQSVPGRRAGLARASGAPDNRSIEWLDGPIEKAD